MPVDIVRDAAIGILLRVEERGSRLDEALDRTMRRRGGRFSGRGRRFLSQLVYGTVRNQALADHAYAKHLSKPAEELPAPIRLILRMGAYQALFCNQVTFPAMVHTSVDLAKKRGNLGLSRLVNAVLKKVPQRLEDLELPDAETEREAWLSTRYSMPEWLVRNFAEDFGVGTADEIVQACSHQAPVTARVNTLRTTREALVASLAKSEVEAVASPIVPDAITIARGRDLISLKAFQNGLFFLQDHASMLPVYLLDPQAGMRVMDLCAAPGGKATHIAERMGDSGSVIANDLGVRRLGRVLENVERLGTGSVRAVASNGNSPPFRNGAFDAVLVDAPCTGLGTMRRHPEIRWRARPEDAGRLRAQQEVLLRSAIRLCKNGGLIVYSVCTFTREETEGVVGPVIKDGGVTPEDGPEWLSKWRIDRGKYRILPGSDLLDGFYLMRLRKAS